MFPVYLEEINVFNNRLLNEWSTTKGPGRWHSFDFIKKAKQ